LRPHHHQGKTAPYNTNFNTNWMWDQYHINTVDYVLPFLVQNTFCFSVTVWNIQTFSVSYQVLIIFGIWQVSKLICLQKDLQECSRLAGAPWAFSCYTFFPKISMALFTTLIPIAPY
jgi:hypothetical protein